MKTHLATLLLGIALLAGDARAGMTGKLKPPTEPVDVAKPLAQLVREADGVMIEYGYGKSMALALFEDAAWRERLAKLLESGKFEPKSHCFCISTPEIQLVVKDRVVLRLSVHHGEKLRAYSDGVGGDFFTGKELCTALLALVKEKPPLEKKPAKPAIKVPPPVISFEKTE